MRKRLVNHKILSVNDCLIIVSNLFISIVTTNNDSPSFLLRVSIEATMPQKGMAWKAAEKTRGKGKSIAAPVSERSCVYKDCPPPRTLANSNFPLLKWFFLISDNIAMYPYLKEHLLLMFVSSNPTVKRPLLHTWKKDLRPDRPPSSLPANLWAFLRSFT